MIGKFGQAASSGCKTSPSVRGRFSAIELDLMQPLVALRRLGLQRGKLGLNEPPHLDTLGTSQITHGVRSSQESRTIRGRGPFLTPTNVALFLDICRGSLA